MREERYQDLSNWEQNFISDLLDGIDGVPSDINDSGIDEYLTRRQIEKVEEIWEGLGL